MTRSILCSRSRRCASAAPTPSGAVIRLREVISADAAMAPSVSKRMSRLVRMPTSLPLSRSTTGKPEMRRASRMALISSSVVSGWMTIGLITMPLSKRFTWRTWSACSSTVRLRWMTPMPPAWAMAMARRFSVTVSMAEDTRGMFRTILRVSRLWVLASVGMTADGPGSSKTSSKVRPSRISIGLSVLRAAYKPTAPLW